ncbi:MAG: signal peptidase I [Planctomycetaceae bacterium]|nr:MAG: signal peptidase I [Planctomycetaceae bacterium]
MGTFGILGEGEFGLLIQLAITALVIVSMWKVFQKAGQPGWAAIIPIYNLVIIVKIANKPLWWIILLLIPIVNIIVYIAFAEKFGKSAGFGVGIALLGFIFMPILAFSDAKYLGGASVQPPPVH